MNRPYVICRDNDDPMEVVWHYHRDFEFDIREIVLHIIPAVLNDNAQWTELHRAFDDTAKDAFSLDCAQSHEICASLGVLVILDSNGSPSMHSVPYSSTIASASISTNHSGSMKRRTWTNVLAGRTSLKNCPCTSATFSQSSIRVRKVRVRMTSDR
jgi:hypothetical protein